MEKVVTYSNIDELVAENRPVLIDFWASWCGPCRILTPLIDEIAREYDGRAVVAKCNIDDCEDIATRFGVRNIPTLLIFKGGELIHRLVGLQSKQDITSRLDTLL